MYMDKMEHYQYTDYYTEDVVVTPCMLNYDLRDRVQELLEEKYPKTYKQKGYIFSISNVTILDNKITMSNQIVLKTSFDALMYTPKAGDEFECILKKSNKHMWVEVGPMMIFLKGATARDEYSTVVVRITDIKSDNTLCFGTIV
jgi:DNA-directed RNA polymerase subunit E'/Rpb7